jgi:Zn-dependent metalloprotease
MMTGTTVADPALRRGDQCPEVDLHRFLGYVVDYYYNTHEHNGWDGTGRDAKGHAHNEKHANNAYYNSTA